MANLLQQLDVDVAFEFVSENVPLSLFDVNYWCLLSWRSCSFARNRHEDLNRDTTIIIFC